MRYFTPIFLIMPPLASPLISGYLIYWLPPITYVALILADFAIGKVQPSERPAPHWLHWLPNWLWVPIQLGLIGWLLYEIHAGRIRPYEAIGLGFLVGLAAGGVGLTDAHELIHRRAWWERFLGQALLASVTYHHYYIEHLLGHHPRAGTPADSVTARRGEPLHAFLLRAIGRSFVSAWRLEARRLSRVGRSTWIWRNRMLAGIVAEAALYAAIAVFVGWLGVAFFAVHSLVAVLLVETTNYIEYYGLERRETAPGVYERYGAEHAWDSPNRFSNWLLFNLPKHASHHLHPGRRHDELVYEAGAPSLPVGYPLAILLAMVPPLWFRVVDPHLPPAQPQAVR